MIALSIYLNGDGAVAHVEGKTQVSCDGLSIACLEGGMTSGNPSVGILLDLDGGRYAMAETSLKLFLAAADALRAKYGDPRQDAKGVA